VSIRRAPLAVLGGLVGISINVMAQEVEPTGVTVLGRDRYRVVEIILVSRITNPYSYDSCSAGREDLSSYQISGMGTRKWFKS